MKMARHRLLCAAVLLLPLVLSACKGKKPGEEAASIQRPAAPATQLRPQTAEGLAISTQSLVTVKRNPFLSYLAEETKREERMKTPLECCDLSALKVLAVMVGIDEPLVLVQVPEGKTYTARKGDRIGVRDGRIVAVKEKGVIVEEVEKDAEGRVVFTQRVELALPGEKDKDKEKALR